MQRAGRVRQSKIGLFLIFMIAAFIITASSIKNISLHNESAELAIMERALQREIEEADQKALNLENLGKYMQTKKYVEDQAKDKLGLVYPDEIVIKPSKSD